MDEPNVAPRLRIGRYEVHGEIAAGGQATVHYGRLTGEAGFSRAVAIKRLHPQFAKDPDFVQMFMEEAKLAVRIRHPNVVATLDVIARDGELFLVMDYVEGESLARLARAAARRGEPVPLPVIVSVMGGVLQGLHAAHEATDERGAPLHVVHRDVSPQNVMVGVDGLARVLDFGVAKATSRAQLTREGEVKGKLAYMAPEQLRGGHVDRRADIFAAGIVLWEQCTMRRLFRGDTEAETVTRVLEGHVDPPSLHGGPALRPLDEVAMRALAADPARRFATARQMAAALEDAAGPAASAQEVGEWVVDLAEQVLEERARQVAAVRGHTAVTVPTSLPVAPRAVRWRVPAAFAAGVVVTGTLFASTRRAPEVAARSAVSPSEAHEATLVPAIVPSAGSPAVPPPTSSEPPRPLEQHAVLELAPTPAASLTAPTRVPRRPAAKRSGKPCTVSAFLDDAGVKHFYDDCARP